MAEMNCQHNLDTVSNPLDSQDDVNWLLESTAGWFMDEVYDHLNSYTAFGNDARVMEQGLGNTKIDAQYSRSLFFKLLANACGAKNLGTLFTDFDTGLGQVEDFFGQDFGCNFGNHLPGKSGSLEAALSYYNYATMFPDFPLITEFSREDFDSDEFYKEALSELKPGGRLSLLEKDEPDCTHTYDGRTGRINLCFTSADSIPYASSRAASIPAAGAVSYYIEGNLSPYAEGHIKFDFDDRAIVSIASSEEFLDDFLDNNLIGPGDHISEETNYHSWFEVRAGAPYTYTYRAAKDGDPLPKLFVTVVNPSWSEDVDGEITFDAVPLDSCVLPIQSGASVFAIVENWDDDCPSENRSANGDHYAQFYTFTLYNAAEATISLTSETTDTYLYLLEGVGERRRGSVRKR